LTPDIGVVGQASPKDARDRHAAISVIDLVFCPLNVIELILLSTNATINKTCEISQELFFGITLTLIVNRSSIELWFRAKTAKTRKDASRNQERETATLHTRSANWYASILTSRNLPITSIFVVACRESGNVVKHPPPVIAIGIIN
jgi:hypothetical protein